MITKNLIFLTLMLIMVLTLLYVITNSRLLRALEPDADHSRCWWLVFGLCLGGLLLIMAVHGIPLPLFLLLLYGLKTLELLHFPYPGQRNWPSVNLNFLLIAAVYLVVLGVLAFCLQASVPEVLRNPLLRPASLILLLALNGGIDLLLDRFARQQMMGLKTDYHSEESRLFVQFTFFSIAFILLDSTACLFDLPANIVSLFLVGSNGLLMLMVGLFLNQLNVIKRETYLEHEHTLLENRFSQQLKRTEALRDTAYRDALTGAYSRLYAEDYLARLLDRGAAFALAYIDLDGLKGINDTYGHLSGDHYLRDFVKRLQEGLRAEDILARVGGDEFMVLFPEKTAGAGVEALSKIRSRMAADSRPEWPLSFSFGVAGSTKAAEKNAGELIDMADQAMYADKKKRHLKEAARP